MRNKAICTADHYGNVPSKQLEQLPESQAGAWRHRCAACAYELGYQEGLRMATNNLRRAVLDGAVRELKAVKG